MNPIDGGDPRWVAPAADKDKPTERLTPRCVACRGVHGSVVKWRECLELEIRRYRTIVGEIP
jgi:hypothetical protein